MIPPVPNRGKMSVLTLKVTELKRYMQGICKSVKGKKKNPVQNIQEAVGVLVFEV